MLTGSSENAEKQRVKLNKHVSTLVSSDTHKFLVLRKMESNGKTIQQIVREILDEAAGFSANAS